MLKRSQHLPQQATRALTVLYALSPLFDDDLDDRAKAEQIEAVRSLPFPSHSKPFYPRPRVRISSSNGGGSGGVPGTKTRNRPSDQNASTKPTTTEGPSAATTAASIPSSSAPHRPAFASRQQSSSSQIQPRTAPSRHSSQDRLNRYPSYNQHASPSTTTTENTTPTPPPRPGQTDPDPNNHQSIMIMQQQQQQQQYMQQQSFQSGNAIALRSTDKALIPARPPPPQSQTARDPRDLQRVRNGEQLRTVSYRHQELQEPHYSPAVQHNHSALPPPPHTVKPHSPPTPTPPILQQARPRQQLPPLISPSHRTTSTSVANTSLPSSHPTTHLGPNDPLWAMGMGLADSTGRWGTDINSRTLQRQSSPPP